MATDHDRYGRALGKRFRVCAGVLSFDGDQAEQAQAVAHYTCRMVAEADKELGDLVRAADQSLRKPPLFPERYPSLDSIALAASRSLPAAQLSDVATSVELGLCPRERLVDELAARTVRTVRELLLIERECKNNRTMHARFEAIEGQAARVVAEWMRRVYLGDSSAASIRAPLPRINDVDTLLGSEVPLL
jgi:hypothetical protein